MGNLNYSLQMIDVLNLDQSNFNLMKKKNQYVI